MERYFIKVCFKTKEIEFDLDDKEDMENIISNLQSGNSVKVVDKNKMPLIIFPNNIDFVLTRMEKVE